MATSTRKKTTIGGKKQYTRVHTNKTAFDKHVKGLKKRGAKMKIDGMTIVYSFPN